MKKYLLYLFGVTVFLTTVYGNLTLASTDINNSSNNKVYNIETPKNTNAQQVTVPEENATINVVNNSLASVVTIGMISPDSSNSLQLSPLSPFTPRRKITSEPKQDEENIGSGFIVSQNGIIVTNKHVVSDKGITYQITLYNGKKYPVTNIYRDPINDIALLKIDISGLQPLGLGESNDLKLGQTVVAIGTPLGQFNNTVTTGIISGLDRGITAGSPYEGYVEKLEDVIQTDASINPGNSGGPLLDLQGNVIGINTAIAEGGQNISFAIPADVIKNVINRYNY